MREVWKVNLHDVDGPVQLPIGAVVIATQYQRGELCIWAIVDPAAEMEDRQIHIIGTGKPIPDGVEYVGTVQDNSGYYVWHVFA
jgi:hypothetical protein